jgi:hypothetical protein
MEEKSVDGVLDKLLGKAVSRKLLVWMSSSAFLWYGSISGEQWVAISLAYIGIQGLADIATSWKSGQVLGSYGKDA